MSEPATLDEPAGGTLRLEVHPSTTHYKANDPRALQEELELHQALRQELREHTSTRQIHGHKGVVTDIIVELGTGGALTAAVELFKVWLAKRPKDRSIRIDYVFDEATSGKRTGALTVDLSNVEGAVVDVVAQRARRDQE